jgi:hypothetical protein
MQTTSQTKRKKKKYKVIIEVRTDVLWTDNTNTTVYVSVETARVLCRLYSRNNRSARAAPNTDGRTMGKSTHIVHGSRRQTQEFNTLKFKVNTVRGRTMCARREEYTQCRMSVAHLLALCYIQPHFGLLNMFTSWIPIHFANCVHVAYHERQRSVSQDA